MDQAEQQYNMETNDEFDNLTFEEKEEYLKDTYASDASYGTSGKFVCHHIKCNKIKVLQ